MIKVLIVDDESAARAMVRSIVESLPDEFTVIGEARDVSSGVEQIRTLHPDLVLLDIDMPDGNAFDLLQQIGKVDFRVIFITAYSDYAIKAFRFSAIDYILKPIVSTELFRALNKARKSFEMEEMNLKLDALLANLKPSEPRKKVVLKTSSSILCVDIDDIYFCESEGGSYTRFHFKDKSKLLVSKPLKQYDEMLSEFNFFRIHKSYLVNLNKVVSFKKQSGGSVILDNQVELIVSHRRREKFLERYLSA